MKRRASTFAWLVLASVAVACAPDPMGTPIDDGLPDGGGTGGPSDAPVGPCVATKPEPRDPASLPTCCSVGAARCMPSSNVDPEFAKHLAACEGGVCLPEPFVKDPSFAPKTCTSAFKTPGVCLSPCIPEIASYGDALKTDGCEGGDKCVPCVSPIDGSNTGACDLGKPSNAPACAPDASSGGAAAPPPVGDGGCVHTGKPVIDPSTLGACSVYPGAHCLSEKLVPDDQKSKLATCYGGYCLPDPFIESGGKFIPPSCRAAGDVEGRCLHRVLPDVASQGANLVQSTCKDYERCVPCSDPITGKDTGACHQGCDVGPSEPVKLYASCCSKPAAPAPLGTCIPTELVPTSQQSNLDVDTCAAGKFLCVPHEQIDHVTPVTCKAKPSIGNEFTGVCLSTCLKFDFLSSLGMAQGTCDSLHLCAPCTNPITGQPTGAPGCPP